MGDNFFGHNFSDSGSREQIKLLFAFPEVRTYYGIRCLDFAHVQSGRGQIFGSPNISIGN